MAAELHEPRTDDASVRANVVGIAPHVAGPLVELRVVDNQPVKAGDLLFVIDPRPYEARLERARAELRLTTREVEAQGRAVASAGSEIARRQADHAAADATLAQTETGPVVIDAEIARLEAELAAAQAGQARLAAELAYAEDYLKRVEPLLVLEFVTADRVQEARSKQRALAAAVKEAERKELAAGAAIAEARERRRAATSAVGAARARQRAAGAAVDQGRHDAARATDLLAQYSDGNARLEAAKAAVASAELDVEYCRVKAPFDGYVTNLNIAVGEYARQGQQVFALVDNRAWYVMANFRETFLSSIRPGMPPTSTSSVIPAAASAAWCRGSAGPSTRTTARPWMACPPCARRSTGSGSPIGFPCESSSRSEIRRARSGWARRRW